MNRVLLVNMPWSNVESPALGISLLKGILAQQQIPTDIRYFNLLFSEMLFSDLLARTGDAAALSLRCRDDLKGIERTERWRLLQLNDEPGMRGEWLFGQYFHGWGKLDADAYLEFIDDPGFVESAERYRCLIPAFFERCLTSVAWEEYAVVGFSCVFWQTMSSLSLARLLKEKFPHLVIAFGGANCEGVMGEALLANYAFVDYVASGEADRSFPALLERLFAGESPRGVKGILWRDGGTPVNNGRADLVEELDVLPAPIFDDYFSQAHATSYPHLLRFVLPLEQSRGCWWGQKSHCTFCGLNGLTMPYRSKSSERAWTELREATSRYGITRVEFVDNILNMGFFKTLLPRMVESGLDVSVFYEVKANLKKEQIHLLRKAGVTRMQPGIESLSSRVLALMQKGCSALQNVQCLKWARQFGIVSEWNLIYGFPGENPEDYERTFEIAQRITHLEPPNVVSSIRMDRFSPNFDRAQELGFLNVRPRRPYYHIHDLPETQLRDIAYFFDFDYADGRDPSTYMEPIQAFLELWSKESGSLVHVRLDDGGALIHDTRFNRVSDSFELTPFENTVYEFCDTAKSVQQIQSLVSADGDAAVRRVRPLLERFHADHLMVREEDKYLSVAPVVTDKVDETEAAASYDRALKWLPIIA